MTRLEYVGRIVFLPLGMFVGIAAGLLSGLVLGLVYGAREGWLITWERDLEVEPSRDNRRRTPDLSRVGVEKKPAPLRVVTR